MKKLIVVATLLIASIASTTPVSAETVRTCSSVYGGGEVCGETTTSVTVEHKTVEIAETAASDTQMIKFLLTLAGAAAVATGLYKLTYKSYILG